MLTVEVDAVAVEARLISGQVSCPVCGGVLAPWGWARTRVLRGPGGRLILLAQHGWAPDERTLQRMFHRTGLIALSAPVAPATFGRFQADRPNEIWTGDALHGPRIEGRKTYLFAFIDDHSRAIVGHRWGFAEDAVRLAAALRPAVAARGVPEYVYADNGSAFVDAWLLRACAKLGIKLVHSAPGRSRPGRAPHRVGLRPLRPAAVDRPRRRGRRGDRAAVPGLPPRPPQGPLGDPG